MNKFKIGDRAKVNCATAGILNGKECTVVSELHSCWVLSDPATMIPTRQEVYTVEIDGVDYTYAVKNGYQPHELIPIVPPAPNWKETEWGKNLEDMFAKVFQ